MTKIAPEVFSREIVKPFSLGTNHPKTHTLSFFDEIQYCSYVPLVYFYANGNEPRTDRTATSYVLKKSLAAALSVYYPLAGRRNGDNITIDCNEEGVLFLEARIGCNLSEILSDTALKEETLNLLFPDGLHYQQTKSGGPMVVQVTYFDCGGMATSICFCHGIMDLSSICCFFNYWASLTSNSDDPEPMAPPEFNFGALYPPNVRPEVKVPVDKFMRPFVDKSMQAKCIQRNFVVDHAKIAKLKAMVKKETVENPTRVEVVTAFVFRCAVLAAARATSPSFSLIKQAAMRLPVNLRTRVRPPFSERAMGNFAGSFWVSFSTESIDKLELDQMVSKIRNEKRKYFNECSKNSSGEALRGFELEDSNWMEKLVHDGDIYFFSNWCGFRIYEADFGWGKPALVSTARMSVRNWIQMMDTKEGGIEMLVSLEKEHMAMFESDEELLEFATV